MYLRIVDDAVGTVGGNVDALPLGGAVLDVVQRYDRFALNYT